MKKLILPFVLTILLYSCSDSPKEKAIKDYAQTNGNTKIDLKMKILELKKVRDITAKDSLDVVEPFFLSDRERQQNDYKKLNETLRSQIAEYEADYAKEKFDEIKVMYAEGIEKNKKQLKESEESALAWENDCKGTYLNKCFNLVEKYKVLGDQVIASEYTCKYSIVNPLLNNAEQEITTTFYFSPEDKLLLDPEHYLPAKLKKG